MAAKGPWGFWAGNVWGFYTKMLANAIVVFRLRLCPIIGKAQCRNDPITEPDKSFSLNNNYLFSRISIAFL